VNAVSLGPLIISSDRLSAILALLVFLALAEWLARREGNPGLSAWAWNAVFAGFVSARLGFVLQHLGVYGSEPLSALYVWQGGFSWVWGVLGGMTYALWYFRSDLEKLRRLGTWPAFAAAASALLLLWAFHPKEAQRPRLPELELVTPNGRLVNLADFAGKPIVLNVWATWCPPCRRELPMLAREAKRASGVNFVFVNAGDSAAKVQSYLSQRGLELPNLLLDPQQRLRRELRLVGFPTTFFFDGEGRLLSSTTGELGRASLEDLIAKIRR